MSTRANFLIITPDNKLHQYYNHCDSYPEGLGEKLRRYILMALGMLVLNPNQTIYDCFMDVIQVNVRTEENNYADWEDEDIKEMSSLNEMHGDIEYVYIVNFSKDDRDVLYYDQAWKKFTKQTYAEILEEVCMPEKNLVLDKPIVD